MQTYIDRLEELLRTNNVCSSHGIEHCVKVMENTQKALDVTTFKLSEIEKECVLLAALLHDADDRKFFPNNNDYQNLRNILIDYDGKLIPFIIQMVELVSSSKNGDNIPDDVKGKEWMLYPRYADRLEAIGLIGVQRCYKYSITSNNPLYTENTPCPMSEEEIWRIATEERYKEYNGSSESMIDHYFDKLIRASLFPIDNTYFNEECKKRRKPTIDFVLMFSKDKKITDKDVMDFIDNYIN